MNTTIKGLGDEVLMNAAFERVAADMAALRQDELQPITLEIATAVATVLGVLPEVTALRERVVKELPTFNVTRFDKLEDYAFALSFAHGRYLSATQPPNDLAAVSEQSTKVRERLLAEANALVLDGVVAAGQLEQLKGANGYKNVATDLTVLTNVLREAWPQIEGKTRLTPQDLDEALRLSARLLRIVGVREQGPAQVAEAANERQRAYTLLLLAYDDARRAIAFLRADEGDADDIAPALHPGRPRPKKSEPASPAGGASGTAPTVGGQPNAPVAGHAGSAADTATTPGVGATAESSGGPFMH